MMKTMHPIRSLGFAAISLTVSSLAYAGIHLNVDLNPFGWGAPPPVVYYGHGYWEIVIGTAMMTEGGIGIITTTIAATMMRMDTDTDLASSCVL